MSDSRTSTPLPAFCGGHVTHQYQRADAVITGNGLTLRQYVPTIWGQPEGNTQFVHTWADFQKVMADHKLPGIHFNEDQTEITLTLPVGYKFAIGFFRDAPETTHLT